MSRTQKGSKGPGYDYWGRRPLSGDCGYGPAVKRVTHRIERRQASEVIADEITQNEGTAMAVCSKCGQPCFKEDLVAGTECKWCD